MRCVRTGMNLLSIALGAACMMQAAQPAAASPPKPEIVLVHGAFADGSGWRGVHDLLVEKGYKVSIVQEPETSLDADVAATMRTLDLVDGSAVLVGHSWGGQVITQAGVHPKVKSLVYISALMPDAGESVEQLEGSMPPVNDDVKTTSDGYLYLDPDHFVADFAADAPKDTSAFMARSQVMIAAVALKAPVTVAAWRTKPSFAMVAGADRTINPALERWMYARAGARITEVPGSSHTIFISHPALVVQVIEEAARR